jgi:protein phosphatase
MDTDPSTDTGEYLDTDPGLPPLPGPHPPIDPVRVDWAALSHPGLIRPANEDHYLLARAGRFLRTAATSLPDGCVPDELGDEVYAIAVADGMGGEAGGEAASRLAITFLLRLVLGTPDWVLGLGKAEVEEFLDRTARRFRAVNEAVLDRAGRARHLSGMGTTLTLAWSLGAELFVANVGDARAYLLRGGVLRRLTRDHTVAQALADAGHILPEEVATHHLRHVLTRVIGRQGKGEPEVHRVRLADGDRLLVCTDGLTDMSGDGAIAAELGRGVPAGETCRGLIDLALRGGGRDNVTAAVADYRITPRLPR